MFGFPPTRPVAGGARSRFSNIDDSDDDDEPQDRRPQSRGVFRTPFQPHRPTSATTETFGGGEGMSTGSGFGDPARSREEEDQDKYFASLPTDVQNVLNGADDDAHEPIALPPPSSPPKKKEKKHKKGESKEESKDDNVTVRQEQFDIPLSSNRRNSFTDQVSVTGASPFYDQKALSASLAQSKTARTPPVKSRLVSGVFNPTATDEDDSIHALFGPSVKANKHEPESPQSASKRVIDESRQDVRDQSDLIAQVIGRPTAPARRVSIQPGSSKSVVAGSGMGAIPTKRGAGRPVGSQNKSKAGTLSGMEFG